MQRDLTKYAFTDWTWIRKYQDMMGERELSRYINRVYLRLDQMRVWDKFSILEKVDPVNYELFIKAAEWFMMDVNKPWNERFYEFDDDYTIIKCKRACGFKRVKKSTGARKKKTP